MIVIPTECWLSDVLFMCLCKNSEGPVVYETATLRPTRQKSAELEAESNLFRCMSDASLVKRRRGRGKSAAQREKERQHRFSINGHFYNYKVDFRSALPSLHPTLSPGLSLTSLLHRPPSSPHPSAHQLKCASPAGWPQTRSLSSCWTSSRWAFACILLTPRVMTRDLNQLCLGWSIKQPYASMLL